MSSIKADERRAARKRGQNWADLQIQPSRSTFIDLRPLDVVPHDMLSHMQTVSHVKGIRPSNGLDSFLSYSKRAKVCPDALDPLTVLARVSSRPQEESASHTRRRPPILYPLQCALTPMLPGGAEVGGRAGPLKPNLATTHHEP